MTQGHHGCIVIKTITEMNSPKKNEALDLMEETGSNYLTLENSPLYDELRVNSRFDSILEKAKVSYEERLKKYPL
jgi:hypothetical protein